MNTRARLPQRRPVAERVNDWFEIYQPFPEEKVRTQGARCMDCGVPFCHTGCPVNNIIPDWNDLVYRDRWQDAIRVLHATNNFPEFTGRICPAPCEAACVLGINEPPVTIKVIEKTIIDTRLRRRLDRARAARSHAPASGWRSSARDPRDWPPRSNWLAPATDVTVFEKADRIGGLLRYGIPDFKMEKHLIDRRLEQMAAEGVEVRDERACRRQRAGGGSAQGVRRDPAGRRRGAAARSERSRPRAEGHPLRDGVSAAAEQACARAIRSSQTRSWRPASA